MGVMRRGIESTFSSLFLFEMTDKEKFDAVRFLMNDVEQKHKEATEAIVSLDSAIAALRWSFDSYFPENSDCPF